MRPQKPMPFAGFGYLLQPELDRFLSEWQGPGPKPPEEKRHFLMEIVWNPDSLDSGPRGDAYRCGMAILSRDYPGTVEAFPKHARAERFAALYAEFPNFVAGWLNQARQFLASGASADVARRWLLTKFSTAQPDHPGKTAPLANMQLKEIGRAIKLETGVKVPESTLR